MRALVPVLTALVALVACAKEPLAPVGTSTAGRGNDHARTAPASTPPPAGANPLPADFRERFVKVGAPFVSSGHASGRWRAQVYANELGARALAGGGRDVEVGAILVEEHTPLVASTDPGPRFVMEKRAPGSLPAQGDWRYVVFGASGQMVADGAVEGCAGCHDAAPGDRLFAIVP